MHFPFQGGRLPREARSSEPKQLRMSPLHWVASFPKQVVLTMQASAILLFAVCLQTSAATYSQTVSFTGKDVPLKTVFTSLKKQTGYGVFYQTGEAATLEGASNVTLDLKNVALDLFLQTALRNQPLEYSVEGTTIFIKKKDAHPPLTVELAPGAPIAEIHGRVTNDKGESLVNANITVKRTGHGTITDANGNFTLRNINSEDVITVSFIGYQTQSVPLRDRTNLTVFLQPATNDLDKVVVQAYGTTSHRLATGNINTVGAEEIAKQPVTNVLQAIQGQVPGMDVTNTSAYATGPVNIEIRGRNTINPNFSADPLYIVDGVPMTIQELTTQSTYTSGSQGVVQSGVISPANGQSPFFGMDPNDIESIEVLKDADATAIYGSRGSNGVMLITTKKGKVGKTNLHIDIDQGINETPRYYHMLNTRQFVAMREEALNNDGLPIDVNNAPDLVSWDTTRYTDWQKYMWGGHGKVTNTHATLSGGDPRTTFRVGAGYLHQTDILNFNGANRRGTFDLSLNHKSLNQRLSIAFTGFYSIAASDEIFTPSAITLPPNAPPIFDSKGNLNYAGWAPLDGIYPFGFYLQPYTTKTNMLNSNLLISYEFMKGLTFRASFGYNNAATTQTSQIPIAAQDPANNRVGSSQIGLTFVHNVIIEPQIEYNGFLAKGKFNVLLGATSQVNSTTADYLSGLGYQQDALLSVMQVAPTKIIINSGLQYKYDAFFGRLNYNWNDKYILNLNGRRDGSSKFGPGRQYGNFGSVGAAWVFSEENWFRRNIPIVSFAKLRASYGIVGGDQLPPYQYLSLWTYQTAVYNNSFPLIPTKLTDSLLQWQVNKKLEAAIDLSFLKDRISLEAAWYRDRTNNQLVSFPTPQFSGFGSVTANSPASVQNQGFEFMLNVKILDGRKFKWSSKFNISFNSNKLLAYPNLSQSPYASTLIIGKSLGLRRVLHTMGIDPQTGQYSFQDKNHDGQITYDYSGQKPDDSYAIDMAPKYYGGFLTNLSYEGLEVSIFFYFKKKIAPTAAGGLDAPGDMTNQPVAVLNHWQKAGDITDFPKFTTQAPPSYNNYMFLSDGAFGDASFIRLQNLQVAYSLPASFRKKAGLNQMKLFVQGRNLFIITHYNGLDPDIPNFGGMPLPRTVVAGISCEF